MLILQVEEWCIVFVDIGWVSVRMTLCFDSRHNCKMNGLWLLSG
jgi:hypothetical protein